MKFSIRLLYLYLFSFVGLIVAVIGMIQIVNLGLKVYVFNGADQYTISVPVAPAPIEGGKVATQEAFIQTEQMKLDQETQLVRQRQRDFSGAIAMIIIGLPLYAYHWKIIQRENKH